MSQISSQTAKVMALYSALDLATTCCFLLFQDIKLPPIETQYPEVDLLSDGDPGKGLLYGHNDHTVSLFQENL